MPTLFASFNEQMPSNDELIEAAIDQLGPTAVEPGSIKANFSTLLDGAGTAMYQNFLSNEKRIGDEILREYCKSNPDEPFNELNSFFLSLFQARKPRAGKAFEKILKELFRRIGYPFDEQRVINGQPDFLMPSEDHYHQNPMDCIIFTVKRTLRERWRQIVTEGVQGLGFFLATIDEEIAPSQLPEMLSHRVYLVVPARLKSGIPHYQAAPNVLSFEEFFERHLDPAVTRWRQSGVTV